MGAIARVADWVEAASAVTVLTGAGVSTDSGIPDFRGPQGVWTKDPAAQMLFTLETYLADPQVRQRAWRSRLENPVWRARPNAGHQALAAFERTGRLRALVTQNIDGLHQRAGSTPERVIEIHGTVHWVKCMSCDARTPTPDVLARVTAGEPDPPCHGCGGIQKPATISFGESLDPEVFAAAVAASRECDLFLAVGTSLSVQPAAGLCDLALRAGARLVVMNAEPTPYDKVAHAVVREPIGEVLPELVAAVGPYPDGRSPARTNPVS
jgi:NAD-dependent deacetylase